MEYVEIMNLGIFLYCLDLEIFEGIKNSFIGRELVFFFLEGVLFILFFEIEFLVLVLWKL